MDFHGEGIVMKEKLTELYKKKDMESFAQLLEGIESPKEAGKLFVAWANDELGDDDGAWCTFGESLNEDQHRRIFKIDSREREMKYLLKKAERGELTDEEWGDLRVCDYGGERKEKLRKLLESMR